MELKNGRPERDFGPLLLRASVRLCPDREGEPHFLAAVNGIIWGDIPAR
tara:strand:+ start:182 stop:328 length:147 start_codon:yes stop_codon:yes gene_type:complete